MTEINTVCPTALIQITRRVSKVYETTERTAELADVIAQAATAILRMRGTEALAACQRVQALLHHIAANPWDVARYRQPGEAMSEIPAALVHAAAITRITRRGHFDRRSFHVNALLAMSERGHA
jgi:dTDP-4-dehydrorhamnose reductase